uniref:Transmembrane protein n=1 Tax=Chromera velia CCMP2878 TaxID=1169474 RepID=A0A0G4F2J8_9ALVE|eukprot:Cvel_14805.t1-p1 / transcript=Cvel_14805.t1 / gene=Cvel_14805 / organism=Chromera_velia_CCMP2878 / gene_product=hypothetical protein / transcript_product=hypothetical protein / location=Cvel_scaffold1068:17932-25893(+) / protein_length=669 / sequence_SO=supercontig / SO=protein_coding / is_pseudo=false
MFSNGFRRCLTERFLGFDFFFGSALSGLWRRRVLLAHLGLARSRAWRSQSWEPRSEPPGVSGRRLGNTCRKPTRFPEDLNLRRWKRLSPAKRRASRQTPLVTIPENREVTLWTDAASLSASLSSSSCSSSSSSSSGTAGVRRGASFPPSSLASLQRRLGGRSRRSVSLSRSLSETELEVDQTRRGGTGSSESGGSSFSSLSFLKEAVKTLEPLDDDDLSDSMASDCSSSSSISSCSSSSEGTGGRHRHRHNSFTQALFPSLSSSVSESSGSHGSRLNRQGPAPLSLSALSLPHPLTAETLKEGMWRRQMETERETETETATEEGHMGGEREGDGGPGGRQQQTVGDGSASASLWLDRVLRFVSGLSASTASGSGSEGGGGSGSPSSSPEARGVEVEREGIVSRWAEEKPEEPVVASGSAVGGAEGKTRSFGANADTSSSSTALPVDPSVSPPFSLLPSSARPPRALTASVDAEEEEDASLTVSASSSLSASTQATETEGERQVHAEREAASSREGERSCRLSSGSAADLKVNEGMLAADSVHEAVELWAGKEGGQGGGADRPSQFSLSLLPGLRGRPANASLAFVLVVFLGVLWDLFVAFRGKGKRGRRKRERGGGRERLISFILGGGTAGGGATRPGGSAGVRLFWRLLSSAVSSRLSRRKQTVKAIL